MKNILVTGANRGIGKEIAKQLGALGHHVIIGSRDLGKGLEAVQEMEGSYDVVKLDVNNEDDIFQLVTDFEKKDLTLDVLINNAGIISNGEGSDIQEMKLAKKVFKTNFFGPWELSQLMIPFLLKSDDGRIVNMSSGMGALSDLTGGYASYRLSKSALNSLTILMSNDLRGQVSVNAMCPGWVRTDMGGSAADRSVHQGADTAVWLATVEVAPTGKFFRDRKEIDW